MKDKEIVKAVEKSGKRIQQLAKRIEKDFDDKAIHGFRVEIKTLRAFLRLLSFESGTHQPAIPKKIKTFYSHIGMVRNHRLQRQYTSKFAQEHGLAVPTTYLQMLDREEAHWKQQASKLLDAIDFVDELAKIEEKLPGKLTKTAIHWFVKAKLNELNRYQIKLDDDDALHSIRKGLKDFQYDWSFIKKHAQLPAGIANSKEIKTVTTLIGAFMDAGVQLSAIQQFDTITVTDAAELKTLQQMEAASQHQNADLKQQVIAAIEALDLAAKKPKAKKATNSLIVAADSSMA